jgi:hypothetical protein
MRASMRMSSRAVPAVVLFGLCLAFGAPVVPAADRAALEAEVRTQALGATGVHPSQRTLQMALGIGEAELAGLPTGVAANAILRAAVLAEEQLRFGGSLQEARARMRQSFQVLARSGGAAGAEARLERWWRMREHRAAIGAGGPGAFGRLPGPGRRGPGE